MYVISRVLKCQKREHSIYQNHFLKPSTLDHFPGFIKKELMIHTNHLDMDVVLLLVFFQSKKDYYRWEGSPEHLALHKDKQSTHHQKLDGVIEVLSDTYHSLGTVNYSDKS